jgi:nicotinamide-nucleotide amidase
VLVAMQPAPRVIMHHRVKCFGVGESDLEAMLPDMIRRKREPLVGITVHDATITLRITASGANEAECLAAMGPTIAEIHEHLGVLVFGEEEDELEHAVVKLLEHEGHTLGVVEWGTDGLVSHWLVEAVGSNSCFCGGQVFPISTIRDKTPNFEPAAKLARQTFAASIGLAVGLVPADSGSSTLHIAVASGDNVRMKVVTSSTHPAILKARSAKTALNMVRLTLLNRET